MRLDFCCLMLFFVLGVCQGVIDIDNAIKATVVSPVHFRAGDNMTLFCGPAKNKYDTEEYIIRSTVYYTSADPAFNDTYNSSSSTNMFEFGKNIVSVGSILCMVEVRSRSKNTLVAYGSAILNITVEPFLLPLQIIGENIDSTNFDLNIGKDYNYLDACTKKDTMRKYANVFDRLRKSYFYQMTSSMTSPDDPSAMFYETRRPAILDDRGSVTVFKIPRQDFMSGMNYTFSVSLSIKNTKHVIANGSLTFLSDVMFAPPPVYRDRDYYYARSFSAQIVTEYAC